MQVTELRKLLESVDGDRLVVLPDGHDSDHFLPLRTIDDNNLYKDGDTGLERLSPELEEQGYGPCDMGSGYPALVLWP